MWTWKAVSKGGTNCRNSSSVRLVKSSTSVGRVCRSVNRHVPIAVGPRISQIEMNSIDFPRVTDSLLAWPQSNVLG